MSRRAATSGKPFVRRGCWFTSLQFNEAVTQSRMYTWWPDRLQVGYTRTMLAALLVQPAPARIGILGLGGGSQAKFCHRFLPQATIEACESNADVLALRNDFLIPPDSDRLQIVHQDAARFVRQHRGRFDLLLLDAYDLHGIPETLAKQDFYNDCRDALTADGILAANLYSTTVRRHVARLRHAFEGRVQVLDEARMSNRVAFAWREQAQAHALKDVLGGLPAVARRQMSAGMRRLAAKLEQVPS